VNDHLRIRRRDRAVEIDAGYEFAGDVAIAPRSGAGRAASFQRTVWVKKSVDAAERPMPMIRASGSLRKISATT
jgi:hypothetical protein